MVVDGEHWMPLVDLAGQEAMEAFETEPDWPTVEGAGGGLLRRRRQVPLAGAVGGVAGLFQHFGDRCSALRQERVGAGETACHFGNGGEADRMVVAAREERSAAR